ncbi:MAG: hypothetical protein HQM08_25130 [Candidatus Riflebacteria bacterium]|nr:hypothetical protein [Candidatus Riflebacteria bacterium]
MIVQPVTPLEPSKEVLRLVRKIPRFVPDGKPPLNGEAFQPSSEDSAEANRTSQPVRVSVWDLSLTTISQAKSFRENEVLLAFGLKVLDVHVVRKMFELSRLEVVADPLEDSRPGAIGHCGIQGLDRQAGEPSKIYKAAKDELARRAWLLEG